MKKFFAIAACAALLTGCDFVGGSGESVSISGVTINAMPAANDLYVEIQDAGGRAIASSEAASFDGSLPYDVPGMSGDAVGSTRSYFLVLMEREQDGTNSLIAASEAFSPDELRAAADSRFQIGGASGIDAELMLGAAPAP